MTLVMERLMVLGDGGIAEPGSSQWFFCSVTDYQNLPVSRLLTLRGQTCEGSVHRVLNRLWTSSIIVIGNGFDLIHSPVLLNFELVHKNGFSLPASCLK